MKMHRMLKIPAQLATVTAIAYVAIGLTLAEIPTAAAQDSPSLSGAHIGHRHHGNQPATPVGQGAPEDHGPHDKSSTDSRSTSESSTEQPGAHTIETPGGRTDSGRLVDGIRVFHLEAQELDHEFAPGLTAKVWGYNGTVHGPTLVANEGETVRIYVTNRLPAATTVHWHGFLLPSGMDGVAGLSQPIIPPGETFRYEFTVKHHGTYMYHSHHDEMVQMAMGLMGMFVVLPKVWREPVPDRDFVMLLSEWYIPAGASRPDPNAMEGFNILTINGKAYPATGELHATLGQRVRIRIGNLSAMDHHPMHLHGNVFAVVATDGGTVPITARWPETTVLVPVGTTRDIEFTAQEAGDWAFHCHMTHHVMNQMGHGVQSTIGTQGKEIEDRIERLVPGFMWMGSNGMDDMSEHAEHMETPRNSIAMKGARGPHGHIGMGGMFTVLKVRSADSPTGFDDWHQSSKEQQARPATPDEMERDLSRAKSSQRKQSGHTHN